MEEQNNFPNISSKPAQSANDHVQSKSQRFTSGSQRNSVSVSISSLSSRDLNETNLVDHHDSLWNGRRDLPTEISGNDSKEWERVPSFYARNQNDWRDGEQAGRNEHSMKSGELGMCKDPYCTTCPTYHNQEAIQANKSRILSLVNTDQVPNSVYGKAKSWVKRLSSFLHSCIPGVMSPHAKVVHRWNQFFLIACLMAIFVDPLFFFLLTTRKDHKCIVISMPATTTIVILRSVTDVIYFLHILLQFRLAFVAPESKVVGAGDVVDRPKEIALNYLRTQLMFDVFAALPLPQLLMLVVLPNVSGSSGANTAKNFLRICILLQYIPRLIKFLHLLAGQTPNGFIFESAWANFVINLLTFVLAGHVVGSCWYLFGLQRVNQCLRDACHRSGLNSCARFIDCGHGDALESFISDPTWGIWKTNENASACFGSENENFDYGIYTKAVKLTTDHSFLTRYAYSLFWGFQQISTLAGNQTPSYFVWEVLFTMGVGGLGLLLFALLIGNMQTFLQALGQRRLQTTLKLRDVERWMSHRRLPEELRRQVRKSERYNWTATRGINEEELMENLPENLQRDIRRHLFKFVKKVRIFAMMDDQVLDAFCERLKQVIYIEESKILYPGVSIEKMIFIIRGKLESTEEKGTAVTLSEGDVCGEELLTWCLEQYSVNKKEKEVRTASHRLVSTRTVRCLTNVEAFAVRAEDLQEVTSLFSRFLRNPRVQGAIRLESPYWRTLAIRRIQVAWRYWKKRKRTAAAAAAAAAISSNHS